jgi:hypothetical protein
VLLIESFCRGLLAHWQSLLQRNRGNKSPSNYPGSSSEAGKSCANFGQIISNIVARENVIAGEEAQKQQHPVRGSVTGVDEDRAYHVVARVLEGRGWARASVPQRQSEKCLGSGAPVGSISA